MLCKALSQQIGPLWIDRITVRGEHLQVSTYLVRFLPQKRTFKVRGCFSNGQVDPNTWVLLMQMFQNRIAEVSPTAATSTLTIGLSRFGLDKVISSTDAYSG